MRLIALSICVCLTIILVILLFVGCFTRGWWVSTDGNYNAGLWQHCEKIPKKQCEKFNRKFTYEMPNNISYEEEENIKDSEASGTRDLNIIRGCAVVSLAFSIFMLILETFLLHFLRRKTQVEFAWWLKLVTITCNIMTSITALVSCIVATNYDSIFPIKMELKGSWLCFVIACILSFIIGILLIFAIFIKKSEITENKSSKQRKRKFTNSIPIHTQFGHNDAHRVPSIIRAKSPPFVIPTTTNLPTTITTTTTPYHNHPYMQYHADSDYEPHFVEGYLDPISDDYTSASAENLKIALSNIGDYSTDQYADLSLDEIPKDKILSTSYANLTHSYEDLVLSKDNKDSQIV